MDSWWGPLMIMAIFPFGPLLAGFLFFLFGE